MKGMITDIQRFSLNDGPGIRTTVFLKGCNMRCTWCHNPETLPTGAGLLFYPAKCIGCGHCVMVCPNGAHISDEYGNHVLDRTRCGGCGKCAEVCYAEALVRCGKEMTVEEVMAEIVQDKLYYETSGGGVTLSGGEVMMQPEFAAALADACHEAGIPVAIESNICFGFEQMEELLNKVDLIMCDVKLVNDELHKQYTGVSNRLILENLPRIDALGKPVIVRTPLIPGVTDTEENIAAVAELLRNMKHLERYELLNFNPLGGAKYDSLGKYNPFATARPLPEARLQTLKALAEQYVPRVKVG